MPCLFCQFDAGDVEAFFCGRCGKAQVESVILKHRTTANYDPGDFSWRPWREKVKIVQTSKFDNNYAAMKYEARAKQKTATFVNSQPWRPSGGLKRTGLHRKKLKHSVTEGKTDDQESKGIDADAAVNDEMHKHYLMYLGHPFVKDSKYYKPPKEGIAGPILDIENEVKEEIKSYQKTSPLSIYECHWINIKCPVVCHVGLTETMIGLKRNHYLRIGIMLDDMISGDDSKLSEVALDSRDDYLICYHSAHHNSTAPGEQNKPFAVARGELIPLDILKNEIACISVPSSISWVDLFAIMPNEPYITRHTDNLFQYVAARVKFEYKRLFGVYDQINTIKTKTEYGRTILMSSYNLRPKHLDIMNLLLESYLSVKKDVFDQEERILYLDKSLYTVSKKIRVGKLHFMKFLYCQVRIWIKFNYEKWNASIESLNNSNSKDNHLMVPSEISEVILQVIPLRNDFAIKPKLMVLTRESVMELTKIPDLDAYIRSSKHAVINILAELCALICFQMTRRGIVVTMSCAVSELDIIEDYFDGDLDLTAINETTDEGDDAYERSRGGGMSSVAAKYEEARKSSGAIKIQAIVRKFIARCLFIRKWNSVYRSADLLLKQKTVTAKSIFAYPYTVCDTKLCKVHNSEECTCLCAKIKVNDPESTEIDYICEFESVDRDDVGNKESEDQFFDYEDDDWILFVSLVDSKSDMSTSMVVEFNHIWDIMSFIYDDVVNNGSLLVDSILNHHNFKISSQQIAQFNESKLLIVSHASSVENKDVIFSIRDMLILPGVSFVAIILVLRGLSLFISRVGQSFLAKYRRSEEVDQFMLLRDGEEGGDDGTIVAL